MFDWVTVRLWAYDCYILLNNAQSRAKQEWPTSSYLRDGFNEFIYNRRMKQELDASFRDQNSEVVIWRYFTKNINFLNKIALQKIYQV